jgi:hypothetical protein
MTRKDFELIAGVLADASTKNNLDGPYVTEYLAGKWDAIREIAEAFADRLGDTNPRFDIDRFLQAALNEGLLK